MCPTPALNIRLGCDCRRCGGHVSPFWLIKLSAWPYLLLNRHEKNDLHDMQQ